MEKQSTTVINAKAVRFTVWLIIVAIIMMFAGLTSAYIVRKAEGNWTMFELPSRFIFSTVSILISSLTLHWSHSQAKKGNSKKQMIGVWISLVLGTLFLILQWKSFGQLVDQGVFLTGNPSGGFLYIITGLHGLHIFAGLVWMLVIILGVNSKINQSLNVLRSSLCLTYWHFVDILWIYLFIFLILNH
ncbi:MAG: cytochrome c oxidase subunit 3 [Sphingobacteriales bacterium]|jgi:cytochrome c oxidase subunit 3